jgi:hypothetical protein
MKERGGEWEIIPGGGGSLMIHPLLNYCTVAWEKMRWWLCWKGKGQVRFNIPPAESWWKREAVEVRVQCGVSGKVFFYDVVYAVAASTLGGNYVEEGLKCTWGGVHGLEKGVGLIFAASNCFVFLVFGFGGVGYVLKPGYWRFVGRRGRKFICNGLDLWLMLIQWTIDINQYFVIFIDSDSDSDKNRGV